MCKSCPNGQITLTTAADNSNQCLTTEEAEQQDQVPNPGPAVSDTTTTPGTNNLPFLESCDEGTRLLQDTCACGTNAICREGQTCSTMATQLGKCYNIDLCVQNTGLLANKNSAGHPQACYCGVTFENVILCGLHSSPTNSIYCHKQSKTCLETIFCPGGTYFKQAATAAHAGSCAPMVIQRVKCRVGEEYKSPSALSGYTVGSMADDGHCVPCRPGFKQVQSSPTKNVVCIPCEKGKYDNGLVDIPCVACASGFYNDQLNVSQPTGDAVFACKVCSSGTFSATVASTGCQVCSSGQYTDQLNSTRCFDCPAGRHLTDKSTALVHHDSIEDCAVCPAFSYNPVQGHGGSCFPCPTTKVKDSKVCEGCKCLCFSFLFVEMQR